MVRRIIKFFDKLEDRVRAALSHRPIVYTIVGGVAIVLFWRGVWLTADEFSFLTGPVSIIISVAILLVTGLFVSFFIGDRIILSGLKHDKKLIEKAESEIETYEDMLRNIAAKIEKMERDLEEIKRMGRPK